MQRRVYCVGLRKHVEADIDDIVPITGKRGTKYQCIGKYSENGKDYVVKSWVPKADYEALHGAVDISAAEEFIGADVEAAEPLAADPVADSPVAEDSSEPLEVAPADKSYFLSETVVLSAIKEMAAEDEEPPETITYDCISCGEEIDDEDGHELVGEFQEKCCLPCFKTAFGAEQTFEAQQKDRKDYVSEQAALRLIKGAYGVKRIVSGPTYYRFVEGTSSKFLMFAVVERNNGTFQAVNVYGRRGANFPTLWTSDPYSTEAQAERASKAKQNKKSRKGYVFLDAEEFRAFMAEHFNSETLNSSESIDNYMSEDVWVVELANQDGFRDAEFLGSSDDAQAYQDWVVEQDAGMTPWEITHIKDEQVLTLAKAKERFTQLYVLDDEYGAESPLDESPVDEDPLTADPSDLGGPEDFSADATIDLEDGEITIHEKGAKSGGSKKLLLGVILVAGLAAAYQNSDAVLEFFEGLKGDEADPILGCMDETANNYDATATEDDGTCTYDPDEEPTA
jgi:predicted DNA-binding WGR domain protein